MVTGLESLGPVGNQRVARHATDTVLPVGTSSRRSLHMLLAFIHDHDTEHRLLLLTARDGLVSYRLSDPCGTADAGGQSRHAANPREASTTAVVAAGGSAGPVVSPP